MTYVYLRSEPTLWTVGHYLPDGGWEPESDHSSEDEAARRTAWLNGSPSDHALLVEQRDQALAENARLRAQLDEPCGSCHPCTNWADETWRRAGRKPPTVQRWDEVMAELAETRTQRDAAKAIADELRADLRTADASNTNLQLHIADIRNGAF